MYGAIVIRPKKGTHYPFPKPDGEVPLILGTNFASNIDLILVNKFSFIYTLK